MSTHDQWQIATVLPDDFQEFDDWVLQKVNTVDYSSGVVVYHRHATFTLYMTYKDKCRKCNAQAPPGLLFLARAGRLEGIGVTNAVED